MAFEGLEYTQGWAVGAVEGLVSYGKRKEDITGGGAVSILALAPYSKASWPFFLPQNLENGT